MMYIDVRTPAEFATGHHPEASNHSVESIMAGTFPDVPRDAEICVYCRSGARAGVARDLMQQVGFTRVTNGGGVADVMGQGA
jgi:phage shock protein E